MGPCFRRGAGYEAEKWCDRRDLNPHDLSSTDFKSVVYTNSTTVAKTACAYIASIGDARKTSLAPLQARRREAAIYVQGVAGDERGLIG